MIKRYFIAPKDFKPPLCEYHYLDNPDGTVTLVIFDSTITIPETWKELPHILDPQGDGFRKAKELASIHPKFHP